MNTIDTIIPFSSDHLFGLKTQDGYILVDPFFINIETETVFGNPMMKATFPDGSYGYVEAFAHDKQVGIYVSTNVPNKYKQCKIMKNGYLIGGFNRNKSKYWTFTSSEDNKQGIMDRDENIIIQPFFDWAFSSNDYAIWLQKEKDPTEGNNQIPFNKIEFIFIKTLEGFQANKAEVFDDYTQFPDTYLYFEKTLNKVVIPNFDKWFNVVKGNHWFFKEGYFGLMDDNSNVLVKPTFDIVRLQRNGLAIVRFKNLYALLDNRGNQVIPFSTDEIHHESENTFTQWKNNRRKEYKFRKRDFWSKK